MKIIPKFQQGGGFNSFFTTYIPVQVQEQAQQKVVPTSTVSSKSQEESTKGKLTEKDLFDMLSNINGLPNDMDKIVNGLLNTLQIENLTGISTGDLYTKYLQNLVQVKIAVSNKQEYDDAIKQANKNGSMAEPAITTDGGLIVQNDDGSISPISLRQYMNNRDQYADKLLSVSELANLRKYEPQLANKQGVVDIINNSMGYQEFQNLLSQAISTIGSSQFSGSGLINTNQVEQGLALLKTLSQDDRVRALGSISSQGLYKYNIIDKNQKAQIDALADYITITLPSSAKTWAALKLGTSKKDEATRSLVLTYLISKSGDSHQFDMDYQPLEEVTSDQKDKVKDKVNDLPQNTPTKWLRGLGVQQMITINSGTNYAFQVRANTLPLTDSDKKYLGSNSSLQQASQGEFGSILDFNNASMGMKKIDPSNFGKVILTDGKISSIDFPFKVLQDGTIVPDLSPQTQQAKFEADKEIRQLGIDLSDQNSISANYKTINNIYAKHNLSDAYNADGTPSKNWTRFGVINASASNSTLGMDQFDNNDLLQVINDDAIVDNLLQITKEEEYDKNEWYDWNGVDHFYKGTVWIPVDVSYIAAQANNEMKTEQVNEIINREAALNSSKMLTKEKK